MSTFIEYLGIGFSHILPDGMDHVLFVLALFFSCRSFAPLLWQVTLFTVAHSMTMGLAMAGVWDLPSQPVEVMIAVSIALVAAENLFRKEPGRWRSLAVFASGLVHGLGFAHSFREHGRPEGNPVASLLGMSLGVEMGHIAVIALAFLVFAKWWDRAWYRRLVAAPASLAVAFTGCCWAIQRLSA